jgi:hypothetical protein
MSPCVLRNIPWIEIFLRLQFFSHLDCNIPAIPRRKDSSSTAFQLLNSKDSQLPIRQVE